MNDPRSVAPPEARNPRQAGRSAHRPAPVQPQSRRCRGNVIELRRDTGPVPHGLVYGVQTAIVRRAIHSRRTHRAESRASERSAAVDRQGYRIGMGGDTIGIFRSVRMALKMKALRRSGAGSRRNRTAIGHGESDMQGERQILTTREAAEYLGLFASTLHRYRVTGEGPVFHRFGARVRYSIPDLDKWAALRRRASTADDGTVLSGTARRELWESRPRRRATAPGGLRLAVAAPPRSGAEVPSESGSEESIAREHVVPADSSANGGFGEVRDDRSVRTRPTVDWLLARVRRSAATRTGSRLGVAGSGARRSATNGLAWRWPQGHCGPQVCPGGQARPCPKTRDRIAQVCRAVPQGPA